MGQGTESCGGYDVEYDPYNDDESLAKGLWLQKDGSSISVNRMSDRHIRNTIRLCENLAKSSTFSSEEDKWDEWVSVFNDELWIRLKDPSKSIKDSNMNKNRSKRSRNKRKKVKLPKGLVISKDKEQLMQCHCMKHYSVKTADLRRGWGLSCSKSCAAKRRTYNLPAAKNAPSFSEGKIERLQNS